MKIKTADLTGPALNWAVGTALELPVEVCQIFQYGRPNGKHYISIGETDKDGAEVDFEPSEEWSQGGPIIERARIALRAHDHDVQEWSAEPSINTVQTRLSAFSTGPTPLISACRCFVAARLGDEVDVPDELV